MSTLPDRVTSKSCHHPKHCAVCGWTKSCTSWDGCTLQKRAPTNRWEMDFVPSTVANLLNAQGYPFGKAASCKELHCWFVGSHTRSQKVHSPKIPPSSKVTSGIFCEPSVLFFPRAFSAAHSQPDLGLKSHQQSGDSLRAVRSQIGGNVNMTQSPIELQGLIPFPFFSTIVLFNRLVPLGS